VKLLYQSFLRLLATATDKALARYLQFLKSENEILRSKLPKRITVSAEERRRLLKFGKPLGAAIKDLITIVSPRTFARWASGEKRQRKKFDPSATLGRPRTDNAIRDLILKLARETGWGYTRILGELKKLGVRSIARSTVVNILRENGLDPGPKRGEGTWDEFVSQHAQTLWACDFFSKNICLDVERPGGILHFLRDSLRLAANSHNWHDAAPRPTVDGPTAIVSRLLHLCPSRRNAVAAMLSTEQLQDGIRLHAQQACQGSR
jgi:hypothetical protein